VKTPLAFQIFSKSMSSRTDALGSSTTNKVCIFVRQGSERKRGWVGGWGGGGVHERVEGAGCRTPVEIPV
jgi:hypothetical protein